MSKLIIPKDLVPGLEEPVIFLAGPITAAPIWHDDAINYIFSKDSDLIIASPRHGIRPEISEHVVHGVKNYFERSRAWERHYLEIAGKKGAIMFWLPEREDFSIDKIYGAMTRVELGEAMRNYALDNSHRFCVGTDGKFPEFSPVRYDLSKEAPEKVIYETLDETCDEAIRLART